MANYYTNPEIFSFNNNKNRVNMQVDDHNFQHTGI